MTTATKETLHAGPVEIRFLIDADESGGSVTMFECLVPASVQVPAPHSHDAFEETIYGLEGVTTWTVDARTLDIRPGEAFCIARGAVHGFGNHGTEDAKFLAVATPGVMGPDYFREVHDVLASNPGGPPDLAKIAEVMRRHGLTPAPPAG
jgi:quercetin dioxygenase-like cupin family protein